MRTKRKRRLAVKKETLRDLRLGELSRVRGGDQLGQGAILSDDCVANAADGACASNYCN